MSDKNLTITIKGENPEATAIIAANVVLLFRKLGVHPQLVSGQAPKVMQIGADDTTSVGSPWSPRYDGRKAAPANRGFAISLPQT